MERKHFTRWHHDFGVTEVIAPSKAHSWQEPYLTVYPLWVAMAQEGIFNKEYFCRHIDYPHYAFEFVLEGEMEIGKGENSLLLTTGEATILNAGEDSTLKTGKCGFCHKISCTFTGELAHVIFSALRLTELEKIIPENSEKIISLIRKLIELLMKKVPGTEPEVCGIGYQLLHLVAASVPREESQLLERAKRLLTLSIPVKEEIRSIAQRLNTNINTLERLFRTHLGITPRNYLFNLRMQTASELLRNSTMRIGQISERVGYSDPLAFSHAFKRANGISPREFRKSKKKTP